ncbi:MAG: HAMP domain-containing sensor histidine kinase [Gammaproteobacteria bacterium]|nr:HAMP domain-containing sensor histidine kinase [Gammaproteobacteria bacterium]MDP6675818.1 HAMP domain-containing sensor histidine kinase [Gammaproteobacteria bacterium]
MIRLADQLRTTTFLLTLRYMVLFFLSVTVLFIFISWSTTDYVEQETKAAIQTDIAGLNEQYRQRGPQGLARIIAMRISANPDGDAIYLLADANLTSMVGSASKWPTLIADVDGWVTFEYSETTGESIMVRARVLAPEPDLRLLVGRKVRVLTQLTRLFDRTLFWGLAITLALALTGGLMMSNNVLRRVGQFNSTGKRITDGDLTQRIITTGSGDEFDELANNLNAMMDQIESLMSNIQHISDNIAHDLRTPLTRLRNRLEDLRQIADSGEIEEIDNCIEDADGLLATFASLLSIARIESGTYETALNPINLSQCVRDGYELYKALADEKSISLSCDAPGMIEVRGDRNLLFQAITNLLDNAIKYTPTGGKVSISLRCNPNHTILSVMDSGSGIPENKYEQVLQRFFRLDESRSKPGAGLGLSLVQAIIQRHGARLELEDNEPGLLVKLIFPLSEDPSASALP